MRLVIPIVVALAAKIAGAIFLFYSMKVAAAGTFWSDPARVFNLEQNKIFLQIPTTAGTWPYMFMGWDSAWFVNIAAHGYSYSPQTFTFSPAFPAAGYIINLILQNPVVAVAIAGLLFGVLWIPFLQLLLEKYVGKKEAFLTTILAAFLPYTFLFTTVAYTEGLFLLLTLTSWYLMQRGKFVDASILAAMATLTRVAGVVMILPLLYESLKAKGKARFQKIVLSILPAFALVGFYSYAFLTSGDLLAPIHTAEWSGLQTIPALFFRDLPKMGLQAFGRVLLQGWPAPMYWLQFSHSAFWLWLSPTSILLAIAIPPILILKLRKWDLPLALYSIGGYLGFIALGAIVSFPRFAAVLFPLWIPVAGKLSSTKRSTAITIATTACFFVVAVELWTLFLNGWFIA